MAAVLFEWSGKADFLYGDLWYVKFGIGLGLRIDTSWQCKKLHKPRHPGMDRRDTVYMDVLMWVAFKIEF